MTAAQPTSSTGPMVPSSGEEKFMVQVERHLLREVIMDGCCPLHLRLQLARALDETEGTDKAKMGLATAAAVAPPEAADAKARTLAAGDDAEGKGILQPPGLELTIHNPTGAPLAAADGKEGSKDASQQQPAASLLDLGGQCVSLVAAYSDLAEVLMVRACSHEPLQWAMKRGTTQDGGPMHGDRIRPRLWIGRIAEITRGTEDESVFETRMRKLADNALRVRMEREMQDALGQMEEHIRNFQVEVDRRLGEQEQHVRRLVEERVTQELDTILAAEVVKVQAMVEERVRERINAVSTVFHREVRETVKELQSKLDALADENDLLRDAFAEANLRSKRLFWALHPPVWNLALAGGLGRSGGALALSLRRRLASISM